MFFWGWLYGGGIAGVCGGVASVCCAVSGVCGGGVCGGGVSAVGIEPCLLHYIIFL